MSRFCLILSITLYLSSSVNSQFPDDPKPCKYGNSECLIKTIEYFLHEKNHGDNSINLAEINPLKLEKIYIKHGAESPINIDLVFTKNSLYGLSNANVVRVKGFGKDMTKRHELAVRTDRLDLVGDYSINGKILLLPIVGSGTSNISMVNTDIILKFNGKPEERDGAIYMKIDKFHLEFVPKRIIYKIDNLFNGDKVLGDNMNLFLNENWKDIYGELKASVSSAFANVYQGVIADVFTKYPYDKFFIE